jgi:hypothetical protein
VDGCENRCIINMEVASAFNTLADRAFDENWYQLCPHLASLVGMFLDSADDSSYDYDDRGDNSSSSGPTSSTDDISEVCTLDAGYVPPCLLPWPRESNVEVCVNEQMHASR